MKGNPMPIEADIQAVIKDGWTLDAETQDRLRRLAASDVYPFVASSDGSRRIAGCYRHVLGLTPESFEPDRL